MKKFVKISWQLMIYATLTYLAYNQYKFLGVETFHHAVLQSDIRSLEQKVEEVCTPRVF